MDLKAKAQLRAIRDELVAGVDGILARRDEPDQGDKGELEETGVSWPLEADEPEQERSHPDETPDPADGFR